MKLGQFFCSDPHIGIHTGEIIRRDRGGSKLPPADNNDHRTALCGFTDRREL